MQYLKNSSYGDLGESELVFKQENGVRKLVKLWVIEWSSRQIAKKRHGGYHDVKYINEYGEHQFIFNQAIVPARQVGTK